MWRPDLGDYLAAAAEIRGVSEERLARLPRLALAESALAAPFAGFGDEDAYLSAMAEPQGAPPASAMAASAPSPGRRLGRVPTRLGGKRDRELAGSV